MNIEHSIKNDLLIIVPQSENLDARDAPLFKEKIIELITKNNKYQIILDLHHLNFIDSSGLGAFLSILRLLNNRAGKLKLACLNKPIRTMFELVSMHKIFEIYPSVDEAVNSFKPSS